VYFGDSQSLQEEEVSDSSAILNDNELTRLQKMIKKDEKVTFERVYQATVDGFGASSFHSKMEGKQRYVILVQSQENSKFGGYSDTKIDAFDDNWLYDSSAFVFKIGDDGDRLYKVFVSEKAVKPSSTNLIQFGEGSELNIVSDANNDLSSSIFVGSYELKNSVEGGNGDSLNDGGSLASESDGYFQATEIEAFIVKSIEK